NVPEVALRQLLQQSAREADSFPAAESEQAEQQPEPLPSEPPAAQAQPEPLPSEPPAAQDAHSSQALPAEQPNAEQPNAEHAEQERGSDSDAPRSIAPDAGERLANLGRD